MDARHPRRLLISVIGDGGAAAGSPVYEAAREAGRRAVDHGHRVVTGGLGGVMEAALRGAHESLKYREGDTIAILPKMERARANAYADVALTTGLGHLRNSVVASSDAVIAVGGGAGTLAEIAFAWIHGRMIVAIGVSGWSRELAGRRLDDKIRFPDFPEDCIFAAADAAEALALVARWLPRYAAGSVGPDSRLSTPDC